MPTNTDLEKRLKQLRDTYVKQLPAKFDELLGIWQALQKKWNWDEVAQLHRLIHGLSGSGGSFGFDALSKQARDIETQLKTCLQQQNPPEDQQLKELDQQILALTRSIED